jgi:HlyD family secretion protein
MKKKLVILGVIILAAGSGYYFYNQQHNVASSPILTVFGNVDIRDVALSFRVSGRIEKMIFEEGDQIKKGEIVAVLDKEPFEDTLTLRQAELAEAQAALINTEKTYERHAKLVKTGAVSQTVYDDALAVRDEARAHVDTGKARVDMAQTSLEDTAIHAPNDGTMLTRIREEGSIVSAGEPVYTLALHDPVWVRTYIDEPDLGHIAPGQKAIIITPQVEFTPKSVETTQLRTDLVYRLRVIVDNTDNGLHQGMPVTVNIEKDASIKR